MKQWTPKERLNLSPAERKVLMEQERYEKLKAYNRRQFAVKTTLLTLGFFIVVLMLNARLSDLLDVILKGK